MEPASNGNNRRRARCGRYRKNNQQFYFFDCAKELPTGRRSLCYNKVPLESRKENKPTNKVIDVATAMGITLLTEQQYRYLQTLGNFDTKTSSWIDTPHNIRKLGGALFGDRRYNAYLYIIMGSLPIMQPEALWLV